MAPRSALFGALGDRIRIAELDGRSPDLADIVEVLDRHISLDRAGTLNDLAAHLSLSLRGITPRSF